MRNNLLLVLLVCWMGISAQTTSVSYHTFVEEGKTWETQVGLIELNVYGNCIEGDTLIDGENWKKVYNYRGFLEAGSSYYAAMREADKKVYAIAKGSNRQRLLYDYNLKVGDMVRCGVEGSAFGCLLDDNEKPDTLLGFPFIAYLRVERIDTIESQGMKYRCFMLTMLDSFKELLVEEDEYGVIKAERENIVWVEGIGSGAGAFSPWQPFPPRGRIWSNCSIGNTFIFSWLDFYIYLMSTGIENKQYARDASSLFFNLQGRPLLGKKPGKGVYVSKGRKVVR